MNKLKDLNVYCISHTHWDREWFLNSMYTSEWLVDFFNSLFAILEREPEYRFVLDGQTLIIEDYARELERIGKDSRVFLNKLNKYTSRGQILVGPYYLQPDWQLVSGESLIRNLVIGLRTAARYNSFLSVGWLLDNFGQISQAVQIHKKFGLRGLFVWRGVNTSPEEVRTEFRWESPDGSSLTSVYLIDSYRNAMRLSENADIFKKRVLQALEKLTPFATTRNILLMNGYDQETEPDDILPLLRSYSLPRIRLQQSTPSEYLNAIESEQPELQTLRGSLYSGRYISVFPGTLSSRMYLKISNDRCQRLLERYLEPLHTVCHVTDGDSNPAVFLDLWKLLLKNHPHDDICGVSIDDVHTDMEERFSEVEKVVGERLKAELTCMAKHIDTTGPGKGPAYIVVNPSFHARDMCVTLRSEGTYTSALDTNGCSLPVQEEDGLFHVMVPGVPGFGYSSFFMMPSSTAAPHYCLPYGVKVFTSDRLVENRFFTLRFNTNGTCSLQLKKTGKQFDGLGVFEDAEDAGDTYNYSSLEIPDPVYSSPAKADITFLEYGPLRCTVRVSLMLSVPSRLNDCRTGRERQMVNLPIVTFVTVRSSSPRIDFRTVLKNTARDHRLRVLFPTGIRTDVSSVETQFDVVHHPVEPDVCGDANIPSSLQQVMIGARERGPVTSFPQQSFVDIHDEENGFSVLNRGLPEYEVLPQDRTIALTLFRSVGWLARGDLLSRTGDAGPMIRTPEAQCLREMEFRYALLPYGRSENAAMEHIHMQSEYFRHAPLLLETGRHSGPLPPRKAFFSVMSENDSVIVSCLKQAEDGKGVILRCCNMGDECTEAVLSSHFTMVEVWRTDLKELPIAAEDISEEGKCTFRIASKEICTLKIILRMETMGLWNDNAPPVRIHFAEKYEATADFSDIKGLPVLSPEDISDEEVRMKNLTQKLMKLKKEVADGEGEYTYKAHIATLERSILEARLSMVLCKKKYIELYPEQTEYEESPEEIHTRCREIGRELRKARIKKRTYDYLSNEQFNHH